jgi:hypothetical protein
MNKNLSEHKATISSKKRQTQNIWLIVWLLFYLEWVK